MNVAPLFYLLYHQCCGFTIVFLLSKLCPICMFTLDFAAGPASLRSAHMTLLNNFTKSESPDGLKPLKVTAHSHLNTLPECNRLTDLVSGVSLLFFRTRIIWKLAKTSYPTQTHKRCVSCVPSPSTLYRDIWLTERSTIGAVSGNGTVHRATAAYCSASA